ncbi:LOW QUALITY PROTEIN: Cleavage inducible protein [Phytophthora palmivora]|uniref:Cleavage inducible protein n=1 Tax=Phytophthora palmivora TaxID=4796 RepID=A0A2P4XFW5_9STRA|nr:LOW QUALITY PROTEIN: Cleavage inducible protein [Phytophthora palmivora]
MTCVLATQKNVVVILMTLVILKLLNFNVVFNFKLKTYVEEFQCHYFNSNLIIHFFVISQTIETIYIAMASVLKQGVDHSAACVNYQRDARNGAKPAETSFGLLDDCVGQKIKVFLYKKVVICFKFLVIRTTLPTEWKRGVEMPFAS